MKRYMLSSRSADARPNHLDPKRLRRGKKRNSRNNWEEDDEVDEKEDTEDADEDGSVEVALACLEQADNTGKRRSTRLQNKQTYFTDAYMARVMQDQTLQAHIMLE